MHTCAAEDVLIPIVTVALVFVLIAVRQVGRFRLEIWQAMSIGALVVLATGQISPINAIMSVNLDVMLFLFGMFVVGVALEDSGYLLHISHKVFHRAQSADQILLLVLFAIGFASAILMNDTLAIIGTPLVLSLARTHRMNPRMLLLALAFAVTIGSAMSPIGNPQNLLIAINGNMPSPFVTFLTVLFLPTIVNLFAAFLLLKVFYRSDLNNRFENNEEENAMEPLQARACRLSLVLIVVMICVKIAIVTAGLPIDFRLTYIALAAAAPILIVGPRRLQILRRVDWKTLTFFATMFVLMQSVWDSGFFQSLIDSADIDVTSVPMVFLVSIGLSQLISNVPLVALYLPVLTHAGAGAVELVALAAGSTTAGNLTILGAASNVIIIQNAEDKADVTITFTEFLKVGVPLTVVNVFVYMAFFALL